DPIGLRGGLNPYGYVGNPLKYIDPLGLCKADIQQLDPNDIRFSQSSVNVAADLTNNMKLNGWKGDPIDVVRMADGKLTTVDNTRVLAASRAGVKVEARVHDASEALPPELIGRLTTKRGTPSTWGDAIDLRIGKQSAGYRNQYPNGSVIIG
ncbi:TPA: type IV secretion protein Rhs, partial [Salmonella enterica subsp. enterica serovar Agona]|nr:type IV secretion protein Rhs [Salmonella enterica subsp. enterica serovar Agona]